MKNSIHNHLIKAPSSTRFEKEELIHLVQQNQAYALIDSFFQLPVAGPRMTLERRDTDPLFYELIAWDRVTYQPPYLLQLNEGALNWLLNTLPTERWGIFLFSPASLKDLAQHLQKFVIAKGPDLNPYFLRFHDAAVLEILLQTWGEKFRNIFMAPLDAVGLPSLDNMEIRKLLNTRVTGWPRPLPRPEDCLVAVEDWQLIRCAEAIEKDLVRVIYWHLRNYHYRSVQFIERAQLEIRIQFAIQRARQYRLHNIADLAGFTALMFELAPNFDEHPSFRRVLVDMSLPPESKMKLLSQVITDQEWYEAQNAYDRNFWISVLKTHKLAG